MFYRIAMGVSPPWSARPDRAERVTLRVTLSGGANVTLVIPAEVCREAEPTPLGIADRPSAKAMRQWTLHDEGCPLGMQDGRRFVPPEELRIVQQPRRERPPTQPRRLTLRSVRGGRSRLGCLPVFRCRLGSRFAPVNAPRFRPRTRRPFTASFAGRDVWSVQPGWGDRWL
jgi:hypothetical protein